jgi:hypothetical protein
MARASAVTGPAQEPWTANRVTPQVSIPECVGHAADREPTQFRQGPVFLAKVPGFSKAPRAAAVAGPGSTNPQPPLIAGSAPTPAPGRQHATAVMAAAISRRPATSAVAQVGIGSDGAGLAPLFAIAPFSAHAGTARGPLAPQS